MNDKRLASIDTLRFIAIWAVLKIHATSFFNWSDEKSTGWLSIHSWPINKICSFAVPFFYIAAGYFFGKNYLKEKDIAKVYLKHTHRLLIILIGWSIIYLITWFKPFSAHQWLYIKEHGLAQAVYFYLKYYFDNNPALLFFAGTSTHLWFISALIQTFTLIIFLILLNQEDLIFYLALLALILNPLMNNLIKPTSAQSDYLNPMLGIFISSPPVILGWILSKEKEYALSTAYILLFIGILLASAEYVNYLNLNYVAMSNLIIPLSLLMIALKNPSWGENTLLPSLGKMTLGIYCVHVLILYHLTIFKGIEHQYHLHIPLLILTYLISLLTVLLLKSHPLTRKLVI